MIILLCLIASFALVASSLLGKQDENVTSPNPAPQVTVSADPTEGKPPLTVTFEAEATDVDLKLPEWAEGKTFKDTKSIEIEVEGEILSYEWSGDVSGSGESVSATFEAPGTYTATVTVTSGEQTESDSASAIVTKEKEEEGEATDPRILGLIYMRREIMREAINVPYIFPVWVTVPLEYPLGTIGATRSELEGLWTKINENTQGYNDWQELGEDNPYTDTGRWEDGIVR